ncbi:MAG: methylated-DNA--[protein]-cysteine S-methyltransferase [Chloroflexota bacterium]
MAKTGHPGYTVFNTEAGWVAVLASEKGIKRLTMPQRTAGQARELLGVEIRDAELPPSFPENIIKRLRRFFQGSKTAFPDICDLGEATPFQRRVWEITRQIPYGETRSYRWVAERVGQKNAARAVGQALARNPVPIIIPCHRVVASDGGLGGYSGGLSFKRFLLDLEAKRTRHI